MGIEDVLASGQQAGGQAQFNELLQQITRIAGALAAGNAGSTKWTPIDASAQGLTLTPISCRSFAVGPLTYITGCLSYPGGGNSDNAVIGGLPSVVLNEAGAGGAFALYYGITPMLLGFPQPNTNTFTVGTQAGANVANSALSGATLRFQFFYPTK